MDTINEMAELAFASRLKRLSDRLMKNVSHLYHKFDIDFEASWFTVLYALNRKSPMSVTSLARSLGLTHTPINLSINPVSDLNFNVRSMLQSGDSRCSKSNDSFYLYSYCSH